MKSNPTIPSAAPAADAAGAAAAAAAASVREFARAQQLYNWTEVARFICTHHGVKDLCYVRPFGLRPPAYSVMRDVQLPVESHVDGVVSLVRDPEAQCKSCPMPAESERARGNNPFRNPVTGEPIPVNLQRVHVYGIMTRHVLSTMPIHVAVRLNFYHKGFPESVIERDIANAAAGGIRGEYMTVQGATPPSGIDVSAVPMPQLDFGAVNEFFVATMALINPSNLNNGIIDIPYDVCVTCELPVFRDDEPMPVLTEQALVAEVGRHQFDSVAKCEDYAVFVRASFAAKVKVYAEKRAEHIKSGRVARSFKALPADHVLAWGLRSTEYASAHGYKALTFDFVPAINNEPGLPCVSHLLYFLVDNITLDDLTHDMCTVWLPLLDTRPLSSMAIEFVPKVKVDRAVLYPHIPAQVQEVRGSITLRSYVNYYVEPTLSPQQIAGLAPQLHPNFRPAGDFLAERTKGEQLDQQLRDKVMG